ncbi:MAG: carboxypeptidase-like regulatory domain-containing protein, partial [Bacteroidia bacterium]|nr:carboxypeptidase-like regulatory domain-containing protein [Bacteroidia bacterium]
MGRHVLLWVFLTFASLTIHAQTITQTLKGVVSDKETGRPLAGANIVILNTDPPSGTSTDAEGKFRLNAEIGRISVKVTFLGYEDLFIND